MADPNTRTVKVTVSPPFGSSGGSGVISLVWDSFSFYYYFLFLVLSSFFFVFFQRDTAELSVSHPRNALDVLMYADARNSDGWRHLSKGYIGSYIAEHAALVWLSQQKCVNIFIKIFKLYGLTPLCFMFLRVTLELTVQCMLACAYTDITYCVAIPQAPE